MLKQLLFSAALATVAISASAESKVLWQSEDPAGFEVKWGTPIIISAEDAASVNAGDILKIDVATVNPESGWPQVQLNANVPEEDGGWEFLSTVGGLKDGDVASYPISYDNAGLIQKYGMAIQGDGQSITKISVEAGTVEIGPNTVWFGPRTWTDWGVPSGPVGVAKEVFADLKVGDKLVAVYDTANSKQTLQIILGGWGGENAGPNVATYQAGDAADFMTIDAEAGTVTIEFIEALSNLTWGDKEYDVFKTVKADGVQIQGVATLNQVLYIPAPLEYPEEMSFTLNGKEELPGVTVTQEYTEGTLSINVTGECDADEVVMEFATPKGWDGMLVMVQDMGGDFEYAKKAPVEYGEYTWYSLEFAENQGLKPGNSLAFPVNGEEQYGMIQLVKDEQVYWATIDVTFEVAKAEASEPAYPEALEYTLNGEKELAGVQVTQEMDQGSLSISIEGTSTEKSITLTFETPEGWTGFLIAAPYADLSEIEFAKTRSVDDWMPIEEALNSPYEFQKANSITFPVDEEGNNFAYIALVKDDMVYNSIIDLTFDVKPAGGGDEPLIPESIGVTTYAEGLTVEQERDPDDGSIYIDVTGAIEEEEYEVVLDVPEGWDGYVIQPYSENITIGDAENNVPGPRKISATDHYWSSIEDALAEGYMKGNKLTLKATGNWEFAYAFLYKGDQFDYNAYVGITAKVCNLVENQAAYEAVISKLDALKEKYEAAVAEIKETNPDFDLSMYEEIPSQIAEAKQYAEQALSSANADGSSFSNIYYGPIEEIEGFISSMLMLAANQAAYDKVVATINEVKAEYETALKELTEEYPDYDFSEWNENIGGALDMAANGAKQALDSANEDGEEFFFPFDSEYYEGMIAEMNAKIPLYVANQEAYDKVIAEIDAVKAEYEKAVSEIETEYPEFDMTEMKGIIENAISEAEDGAEKALNVANEDGEAFFYPFSTEEIENMIAQLKEDAATSGVNGVNAADKAIYYDLDGNRINNPKAGMYVKIVDGKATKVVVK